MKSHERDSGFTLVELIVVTVLIGIVALAIGATAAVILRAAPTAQFRIDDARATRGLETWLSYDVASAPPVQRIADVGYDSTALAPNSCGGAGANVVYMEWIEDDGTATTYVVNYRLVPSGSDFEIVRYSCMNSGGGFSNIDEVRVATGVSDSPCAIFDPTEPYADFEITPNTNGTPDVSDDYNEAQLKFCFVAIESDTGLNAGGGNSKEIRIAVSSRNPSDFFP